VLLSPNRIAEIDKEDDLISPKERPVKSSADDDETALQPLQPSDLSGFQTLPVIPPLTCFGSVTIPDSPRSSITISSPRIASSWGSTLASPSPSKTFLNWIQTRYLLLLLLLLLDNTSLFFLFFFFFLVCNTTIPTRWRESKNTNNNMNVKLSNYLRYRTPSPSTIWTDSG